MTRKQWVVASCLFFASLQTKLGDAQTVLEPAQAAQSVAIGNVQVNANNVSGEIVNRSPHIVRNVELMFQYHWLWKNEMKPGDDSPGRSVLITLDRELKPGESASFSFRPDPPLPSRNDGHFMPEVSLAGFAVVIPQGLALR